MSAETVLKVSNLRVELGGVVILDDLSFELRAGQTLVVLGPNGAGKTVLLQALLGFVQHGGEIAWKQGIRIGYVPQRVPLKKDLPVTVGDFLSLKGIRPHAVPEALARVGIRDPAFQARQLGLLSSGQFQRVLIAWALAGKPDVLLFDEPTTGIDLEGEEKILDLLWRTQKDRQLAIVLVTHEIASIPSEAIHVLRLGHSP